ncbi:MAG: type II toxin-antitoxin system VapB family antitoxin [Sandaracinaceae bacterium]|nr:type II toxin-antitoxin system VapB family antitoxin [Sandaracinaceae bacterium]
MKTTVELPDALLEQAKRVAAREGTTLRDLVESGLRRVLAERATKGPFELRDARVSGRGLQPELRGQGWEAIRALAYEGRGG